MQQKQSDHSMQQLLGVCLVLLAVSVCAQQDQAAEDAWDAKEIAAQAKSLGVEPHVLSSASLLANRKPSEVASLLMTNPSATLTDSGAIVFGCQMRPVHEKQQGPSSQPASSPEHSHALQQELKQQHASQQTYQQAASAANVVAPPTAQHVWDERDLSKAFKLHSRSSSSKKIFLEFQGCVTEGTEGWNKYYQIDRIETPPYDTDGNTADFSSDELRDIITIHAGVAEAYSSWDVDVTTENPGFDGLERSGENDQRYGIRMCVGGLSDWTGSSIGGIATLNSFGWINTPGQEIYRDSFAFSSELTDRDGNIHLGYIWKTIVHEVGHTLGLAHKGFQTNGGTEEYYTIPPGIDLWAPVMGVPGRGLFAEWSNGEYPPEVDPSSNFDDELKIIETTLQVLPDEPGTSAAKAMLLCSSTVCKDQAQNPGWVTTAVLGKIARPKDQDWYQLTVANTEPFKVKLTVHDSYQHSIWGGSGRRTEPWRVSNLRPEIKFTEPGVKVTPTVADEFTWQQDFVVTVPRPGTYTFAVQPTQVLNNEGLSMHSVYGNLGSYQLTVTWPQHTHTT